MYYLALFLLLRLFIQGYCAPANRLTSCHSYDETCGLEESCFHHETCDAKDHHCYVLWQNTTTNSSQGSVHVKRKGCFHSGNSTCSEARECVASRRPRHDLFYCCCNGALCNSEIIWAPIPFKPGMTINITEHESEESSAETPVLVVSEFDPRVLDFFLLTILVICFLLKLRQIRLNNEGFEVLPSLDPEEPSAFIYLPRRLRPLVLLEMIRKRSYFAVYRAVDRETKRQVALKIMSSKEEVSWLTEVEVYRLPMMDGHECILKFFAAESHRPSKKKDEDDDKYKKEELPQFFFMTVFQEFGSLQNYLSAHTVTWEQLFKFALSFACGVFHLHEEIKTKTICKPSVAHLDLKSSNVFVKNDLTVCIGDFGCALILIPSTPRKYPARVGGTPRYIAPEILEGAVHFSKEGFLRIDIYSFGLVLWELMSRCSALCDHDSKHMLPFEAELGSNPSWEEMYDMVIHKRRRPIIKDSWRGTPAGQILCETIEECWDHDSEARLSASNLIIRIRSAQWAYGMWPRNVVSKF